MYNGIYKFLGKNSIYSLQFGFWQHYSTSYALLNQTVNVKLLNHINAIATKLNRAKCHALQNRFCQCIYS